MRATKKKHLSVDAGVVASLGRDSIKDHTTAILELGKNSYDAGAKIVDVEIMSHLSKPYIRIADDGCGMTERDIDNHWLRIGYSEKRKNKFLNKRRKTGEKGIGRLSADRLGAVLEVRSRTPRKAPLGIIINWNNFNKMGTDIEDVEFDFYDKDVKLTIPKFADNSPEPKSGTELIIRKLRQEWVKKDYDDLYKQLSLLISPFDTKSVFEIRLQAGAGENREKVGPPEIGNYFEVKLEATLNSSSENVAYDLWERVPKKSTRIKIANNKIPLNQLITNSDYEISVDKVKPGPVKLILFYYPRSDNSLLGTKFSIPQLSTYLKENAGIKLYRDNIRVKPYGDIDQPGGDWLNLGARFAQNPAGRSRPSHRIRPSQLVGALFISRDDNPSLNDSASREGLIQDDNFRFLYEFVRGCILLVEASSHKIFVEEESQSKDDDSLDKDLESINNRLSTVRDDLQDVSKTLSKHNDGEIRTLGETVAALVSKISYATESIEVLESQTRLYRGLATIGIASAVFGHETQIQISRLVSALSMAKDYLTKSPPKIPNSIQKIDIATTASERVLAWGGFALDRIRRDKRERVKGKIHEIISPIIGELRAAFDALNIEIDDKDIDSKVETKVFKIDIESIILNLLTNAYTACRQTKQNRKIKISLRINNKKQQNGYSLTVSDSGPGVNEKLKTIIWEPTFTTKSTKGGASEEGTGMGLAIVDSIVEEMNGTRNVDADPKLGGARFEIWLPIV